MKVQYNRMPDRPATLYYAFGEENGVTYESNLLVYDSEILLMDAFQLDTFVTIGLTSNIRELTQQEFVNRIEEIREVMLQ